jgi:hypothetical protein
VNQRSTDLQSLDDVQRHLREAEDEVARLRVEIWEIRDGMIGSAAQERSVEFLIRENDRLRYLIKRPWRVAGIGARHFAEKASRRVVSKRANMDAD